MRQLLPRSSDSRKAKVWALGDAGPAYATPARGAVKTNDSTLARRFRWRRSHPGQAKADPSVSPVAIDCIASGGHGLFPGISNANTHGATPNQ